MSALGWSAAALLAGGVALLPALREARRRPVDDAARRAAPGRMLALSRGATHCRWSGPRRGPVIVCVHGLTTPSPVFDRLVPHLTALGFRVLVYDLYGRGLSDAPRGGQPVRLFVEQLREVLDAFDLHEDVTLLGYSMGGVIASAFAEAHGERLRRLILVAPAGMGHDLGRLPRLAADWPFFGDWAFHMAFPALHRRATEAERGVAPDVDAVVDMQQAELQRRGFLRSVLASLRGTLRRDQENVHRALAQSGLPVAAIWGREDRVIPLRAMGRLTEWNRKVHQDVIDGAGHGLPYTHPDALGAAIARFALEPPG